jgi:hypothetical protein
MGSALKFKTKILHFTGGDRPRFFRRTSHLQDLRPVARRSDRRQSPMGKCIGSNFLIFLN